MLVRMPSQQSNVCSRVRWGDGRCCSMCTSVPKPTLFWKHKMHFYRLKATLNGTHDPVHLKMPSRLCQTRRVKSSFATASPSRTSSFTKPAIRDGLEQGYVGRSTTFDKLRRPKTQGFVSGALRHWSPSDSRGRSRHAHTDGKHGPRAAYPALAVSLKNLKRGQIRSGPRTMVYRTPFSRHSVWNVSTCRTTENHRTQCSITRAHRCTRRIRAEQR